ncbi:sensor histidine kinase [Dyella telluris]|uniref:histidine kinase n=1 Tax=Dyella telluris TaxID=2763498 RepID=A0A7G8Q3I5_9GAMM|nr:HAMP domain-containing sensor histidine kinase [Dyella telluris]QNK01343.1 HAMP domain-containing histidine kinase [Dyella telluris]
MAKKGRSLATQLVWRVILVQIAIVASAIVTFTYLMYRDDVSYMDDQITSIIADSLHTGDHGQLKLVPTNKFEETAKSFPALWFVVEDEKGQRLVYGDMPDAYRSLVAALPHLQHADIHDRSAPYALTMRTERVRATVGPVLVMAGGAATGSLGAMLLFIAHYILWPILLPLVVVTFVVLPWLVRRAISGVQDVANQSQMIDIDERGMRLEDKAVPLELRPLVQSFNAALERLQEGYDARDRFLASAAHELRMPIAVLDARIETLTTGVTRLRLRGDVARLANLGEQLLDLQRLGKQHSAFIAIDLAALAREVTSDVAPLVVDAGYEIALNAPEKPVMIAGDSLALSRVLTNLIQNAVAHGGGKGLISVDVETSGTLGVRDEGPGIPPEDRSRIFEPFHRLRQSAIGAGLGLHLVREIVTLHGGRIDVTEAAGGGAWFRVRFRQSPLPLVGSGTR